MQHVGIKQLYRLIPESPRGHAGNSWGPGANYKIVDLTEVPGFMEVRVKNGTLEVLFWGHLSLFFLGSMF